METVMKADIFFFVATIGFIILGILGAVVLGYLIGILKRFNRMVKKIEAGIAEVSENAKELIEEVQESGIYRMFFHKKKKK